MRREMATLLRAAGLVGAVAIAAACSPNAEMQRRTVTVYKSPTCGCCAKWATHLEENGFEVKTEDVLDLRPVKLKHGITAELASCHTAVVDAYVIEGHVPADVIMRLLAERPDVAGLAVPGMPIGSPGMEGPNPEHYDIIAFKRDGSRVVYERR